MDHAHHSPSGFARLIEDEEQRSGRLAGLQADLAYWKNRAIQAEDGLHRLAAEIDQAAHGQRPWAASTLPAPLPDTIPVPLPAEVAHSQQPGTPVAPTLPQRVRADACTDCRQGRGDQGCACATGLRLEPITPCPQPCTRGDITRAVLAMMMIVGAVLLLTGCGGGSAEEDEEVPNPATFVCPGGMPNCKL